MILSYQTRPLPAAPTARMSDVAFGGLLQLLLTPVAREPRATEELEAYLRHLDSTTPVHGCGRGCALRRRIAPARHHWGLRPAPHPRARR